MKKTILIFWVILLAIACRKETENANTTQKVYLKSYTIASGGEYLKIKPIYNIQNNVTGFENWSNGNPQNTEQLESTIQSSWDNSGTIWTCTYTNNTSRAVYTIPLATQSHLESNRMPTNIKVYNNVNFLVREFFITSTPGQSFCTKWEFKDYSNPNNPRNGDHQIYENEFLSPTTLQLTSKMGTINSLPQNDIRITYTLGNQTNKNLNSCREMYWLLLARVPDEWEDVAISPYWQALSLPVAAKFEWFSNGTWQTHGTLSPYATNTFSNLYPNYLIKAQPAYNNPDNEYNEWEWRY